MPTAWAPEILRTGFAWAPPAHDLRNRSDIRHVVVHRISVATEDPSYSDSVSDTLRFFRAHPVGVAACGGKMPYPLVVDPAACIWQCQRLLAVTPHAAAHNPHALGVAAVGDFREAPPSAPQRAALVALLAHLCATLGAPPSIIVGHDALPGASRQPDKICPGAHLDPAALRADVAAALARGPVWLELAW